MSGYCTNSALQLRVWHRQLQRCPCRILHRKQQPLRVWHNDVSAGFHTQWCQCRIPYTLMSVQDSTQHRKPQRVWHKDVSADSTQQRKPLRVWNKDVSAVFYTSNRSRCAFDTRMSVQDSTQHRDPLRVWHRELQRCQCRILHSNSSRCMFDTKMSVKDSTHKDVSAGFYLSLIHIWRCRRWP